MFLKDDAGLVLLLGEKAGFSSGAARFMYCESRAKLKTIVLQL